MSIKRAKCPKCGYMTEFSNEITNEFVECLNGRCKAKYYYIMKFNGIYGYNVKLTNEVRKSASEEIAVNELEG